MKLNQKEQDARLRRWDILVLAVGCALGGIGMLFLQRAAVCALLLLFVIHFAISYRKLRRLEQTMEHFRQTISQFDTLEGTAGGAKDRYQVLSGLDDMLDRMKQFMDNQQTEQILRTQAEIHSLQSQINPHFLYNTLDTIRLQALRAGADEVAEMTEALSLQFRYSISRPGKLTTFAEEMDNVASYLLIQKYRFGGKYRMVPLYDKSDPALMNCCMPVMTLQPIIENAIHHGLEPKRGQGVIRIRCEMRRTRVYIEITDNGVGMPPERLARLRECLVNHGALGSERGSGIALLNVDQRIKFYFGEAYGIQVNASQGQGTQVLLTLPCAGENGGT